MLFQCRMMIENQIKFNKPGCKSNKWRSIGNGWYETLSYNN